MRIDRSIVVLFLVLGLVAPMLAFAGTSGPSPIPPPPNFQIGTNTLILCKGIVNEVPVLVSNLNTQPGSAQMQQLDLGISGNRYLSLVGNGVVNSQNVSANSSVNVVMPIFVNTSAPNFLSAGISVNYNYFTFYSDSEVRNISFGVETCPTALSVGVSPRALISGKIENITFNLTNTGNTTLNDIALKASISGATGGVQNGEILTSQPILINSIGPQKTVYVNESFFVNRNASQTFDINVSVNLYNGTRIEQISQSTSVLSSGLINMSTSGITLSPTSPTSGSIFSISFVLTDLGTSGASAVTATAVPPAGFTSYGGSNSTFVGDMQVDSQTPVTLTLVAAGSIKSGKYVVPIRVSYLNTLRQNESTTFDVPVEITGTSGNFVGYNSTGVAGAGGATAVRYRKSSDVGLLLVAILVIAIIVLVFLYYRERKRNQQHKK